MERRLPAGNCEETMKKRLFLCMEVSGCPTTCMHCWANGGAYPAMPLSDVAWVLELGQRFCESRDLSFDPSLLHEMLAHPDIAGILPLVTALHPDAFEPIATTGVPLAIRDDWQDLLAAIKAVGTKTLWFTFHGVGAVHDRAVNRCGAYVETCLAVARAKSAGLRCGCNVFVTKENLAQFEIFVQNLLSLELDEMGWEVARYHPTPRRRLGEVSRPEMNDLEAYAEEIAELSVFWKEKWRNIASFTEGAYVDLALGSHDDSATTWQYPASSVDISIVCRSNLDVYSGTAGNYESFHGNLRNDGVERVFQKMLERVPVSADDLYFKTSVLPTVQELAAEVGIKQGTRIYFSAVEMRQRWLDIALADYRRY
jgi:hypothetical protein